MRKISEQVKIDIAVQPILIHEGAFYMSYLYDMKRYKSATFIIQAGEMASETVLVVYAIESKDASWDDTDFITGALVFANYFVNSISIALDEPDPGETVTINDIVYTVALLTSVPDREFADEAGLAACINDPIYGVPLHYAYGNGDVYILPLDRGEALITGEGDANIIVTTRDAITKIDIDHRDMDFNDGYHYVGIAVEPFEGGEPNGGAEMLVSAVCLREGYYRPKHPSLTPQWGFGP